MYFITAVKSNTIDNVIWVYKNSSPSKFETEFLVDYQRIVYGSLNKLSEYSIELCNLEDNSYIEVPIKEVLDRVDIIGLFVDKQDYICTIILYNKYEALIHSSLIYKSDYKISLERFDSLKLRLDNFKYEFSRFAPCCDYGVLITNKSSISTKTKSIVDLILEDVNCVFKNNNLTITMEEDTNSYIRVITYGINDETLFKINLAKLQLIGD